MAKLEGDQNIPAELLELYQGALTEKQPDGTSRRRYPWKVPHMQNTGIGPSKKQRAHRLIFEKCVGCFNAQPDTGGATPPEQGPRNRSWWFDNAIGSGLWYYDYFIQQSINTYISNVVPVWCKKAIIDDTYVYNQQPDTNYQNATGFFALVDGIHEYRVFLKNPWPKFKYIYLTPTTWYICGTGLNWVKVEIYRVVEEWNVATITWNNQPALAGLVSSPILNLDKYNGRLYIGEYTPAICIKRVAGICGVRWAAAQYAEPTARPYATS